MPPNPERQARLRAKREEMANDPKLREAMEDASAAVLGEGSGGGGEEVPENLASGAPQASLEGSETEADKEGKSRSSFGAAPVIAPPLSKPPIGKPTVPAEAPRVAPRAAPRMGVPRSTSRPFAAAAADEARPAPLTITPEMRADPLGVGPKWKYAEGGSVPPKEAPPRPPRPETHPGKMIVDTTTAASRSPIPRATRLQELQEYRKGGPVSGVSFAKGGGANYGQDYRKGK